MQFFSQYNEPFSFNLYQFLSLPCNEITKVKYQILIFTNTVIIIFRNKYENYHQKYTMLDTLVILLSICNSILEILTRSVLRNSSALQTLLIHTS